MTDEQFTPAASEWVRPDSDVAGSARISDYETTYARAMTDIEAFWAERAATLDWYEPWGQVLDRSDAPFFRWFTGGKTNIVLNALDRHVDTARRNKLALIWEGEPGDRQTFSYRELWQETNRYANLLKGLGVGKGDRVTIYMGRTPELMITMLACVKLGAVHSVVYGGFSEQALADRIDDAQSRVLITSDGAWLRGNIVRLKDIADEAVSKSPVVETVVVARRTGHEVHMEPGRDYWLHDLLAQPHVKTVCETEVMDAEDPLFILYTSGTTGKPKGVLHTHGGYQVYTSTTLSWVFDIRDEDVWWCAADPGWITGHSYIVYAPLILGATSFMYEGAPTYPYPDRWWKLVADYGITILYTAPTAIRGLMRFGEAWPARHDLTSLRLLGSVGEPINPEAWRWYHRHIGGSRCPVMDTWWQTETGGFMIAPVPSVGLKPGSATRPFPGIDVDIVDEEGRPCAADEDGYLVVKQPWPGMLRTVYGDPDRYVDQYWSAYSEQGWYLAGDSARRDADGYIWVIGRIDDVIKVSGYRLGTAEVESGLVSHPAVAESAVIGLPDELRGSTIHASCILVDGVSGDAQLEQDLRAHVRREVGPIAVPSQIVFVDALPKTRSGKIMRRVLKARVQGLPEGDLSTLED
ncbi:MAG: acetate--CoA ligase [Anaerolineaceae bacterium]|nr:acetate--CoA ligase [Anaerolineaceae bacterium]MDE0328127.1 acetate--CoA ligase [Anaerolineaceae bacterium]